MSGYRRLIGWLLGLLISVQGLLIIAPILGLAYGQVEGGSMAPSLVDGELALMRTARPGSLNLGDIIAFRRDGRLILHRLIGRRVRDDGALVFTTKGDANRGADSPILSSEVQARLVVAVHLPGSVIASFGAALQILRYGTLLLAGCAVASESGLFAGLGLRSRMVLMSWRLGMAIVVVLKLQK